MATLISSGEFCFYDSLPVHPLPVIASLEKDEEHENKRRESDHRRERYETIQRGWFETSCFEDLIIPLFMESMILWNWGLTT